MSLGMCHNSLSQKRVKKMRMMEKKIKKRLMKKTKRKNSQKKSKNKALLYLNLMLRNLELKKRRKIKVMMKEVMRTKRIKKIMEASYVMTLMSI